MPTPGPIRPDEPDADLAETALLDFSHPTIQSLIQDRKWQELAPSEHIGTVYDFVRDEIAFGYNHNDAIPASEVLADGYGQCNTKGILLMALLRAFGVRCRLHGFTIHKSLQRGVVPEAVYWLTPPDILHSWVEIEHDGRWINLEGFILDAAYLKRLQSAFPDRASLCAYGAGTDRLPAPPVGWCGTDTYIQKTGINADLGVFDTPDEFYARNRQSLPAWKEWLYRNLVRHWMNARVRAIRAGRLTPRPLG